MTTPRNADSTSFDNRTALVTGAGTGIGAATALALARTGARVALVGRRRDRLEEIADQIAEIAGAADRSVVAVADVADREQLDVGIAAARNDFGAGFDLVCANAGAMLAAPFDVADTGEWDQMVAANITGVLNTVRSTIDDLTRTATNGRKADLVLTSSIGAHITLPGYAVYTSTKAAVTHLGTNLRAEFGPQGVRVHTVEPGMTESDLGLHMTDPQARKHLSDFASANPPIPAAAIADSIVWSTEQPAAVNVATLVVLPTVQG